MKDTLGVLLAYDSNPGLKTLTEHRTVSSIPFGGRYRIIDFMLSGMVNAGITDIGVVVREGYQSLLDHLGSGKDWDISRKREGLRLLPPFGYASKQFSGFRGELDALSGVADYIRRSRHKYVLLSGGDLIANIPLDDMFRFHREVNADVTAVCAAGEGSACGPAAVLGEGGRIARIESGADKLPGHRLLGVYLLEKERLLNLITQCTARGVYSLEHCIAGSLDKGLKVHAYGFGGFAKKPSGGAEYYSASMALLDRGIRTELFNKARPVMTKVRDETSTYYGPDSRVSDCLIADGCYIEGEAEGCILFRSVRIDKGAKLKNCVIMQDGHICAGATLSCVIADKDVTVGEGIKLAGHDANPVCIPKGSIL